MLRGNAFLSSSQGERSPYKERRIFMIVYQSYPPRSMESVHPAIDYATQFAKSRWWQGYAMWQPDHRRSICPQIGSVGYLLDGSWIEIANIRDREHEFGRLKHTILHKEQPLMTAHVKTIKTELEVGASCAVGGDAKVQFNFSCSKEKGALLVLGDNADQHDVINNNYFRDALRDNHKAWLSIAQSEDDSISLGDIILVTGHDKTSQWFNAVLNKGSSEISLKLALVTPMGGAAGTVEFSASQLQRVEKNWGPINDAPSVSSIADSPALLTLTDSNLPNHNMLDSPRNQCIFLRGCKILDRRSLRKLFNFKKKKGVFMEVDPTDRPDGSSGAGSPSGSSSDPSSSKNISSSSTIGGQVRVYGASRESTSNRGQTIRQIIGSSIDVEEQKDGMQISEYSCEDSDSSSEDLGLYSDKLQDPLLLLLIYMLDHSNADVAIADHSDLAILDIKDSADFTESLDALNPPILMEKKVAYLDKVALKNRSTLGKAPLQKGNTLNEIPLQTKTDDTHFEDELQNSQILPCRMEASWHNPQHTSTSNINDELSLGSLAVGIPYFATMPPQMGVGLDETAHPLDESSKPSDSDDDSDNEYPQRGPKDHQIVKVNQGRYRQPASQRSAQPPISSQRPQGGSPAIYHHSLSQKDL
ncbi:hypothetical protein M422DRAFT_778134 [Sphaerobolus stellatus SS14]|nr:hypothetical protein M422DRAFT_778134 [Sphaerobolus stellatus SS14]